MVRLLVLLLVGLTGCSAQPHEPRRAAHCLAAIGRARVLHVPGADADADAGDRTYLVLAKPNVIMNDIRLRGLPIAGRDAAGRMTPNNHPGLAGTLDAPSGTRPLVPGLSRPRGWTANRLPMSQPPSQMPGLK
jgi:hypothetical protein